MRRRLAWQPAHSHLRCPFSFIKSLFGVPHQRCNAFGLPPRAVGSGCSMRAAAIPQDVQAGLLAVRPGQAPASRDSGRPPAPESGRRSAKTWPEPPRSG